MLRGRALLDRHFLCRPIPTVGIQRRHLLTHAHLKGPDQPPLLEQTISQHFASIVSQYGDRPAVISRHQQTTLTYDLLDVSSNALARGLVDLGVKKGNRVAVSLGNSVESATATYALFKLGAVLVPLNPAFNAQQVTAALTHLSASHLFISTETNLPWKDPRSNLPLLASLIPDYHSATSTSRLESEAVPSLERIILVDNSAGRNTTATFEALTSYASVLWNGGDGRRALPEQNLDKDDVVNIQFTSGTTSMPKAACLTHRSILNNGRSIGDRMELTEKDVVCCPPPLFHCFGSILGYMAAATHGSAIVFPTEAFDPRATLHAVEEYKCTALYGVPTMFVSELELLSHSSTSPPAPKVQKPNGSLPGAGSTTTKNNTVPPLGCESTPAALSSFEPLPSPASLRKHLRTGIAAGSSIPPPLMNSLHSVLGLTDLTICYGMTETSPVSLMTTPHDPLQKRLESVGRLLPHVEAKIVDPVNKDRICEIGEHGELAVSGYLVMKGYWGDTAKTNEVLIPEPNNHDDKSPKMWMHTGDEAVMDADGYVSITGRIKDLIIRGGENIHPLEIENALYSHPRVQEVSVVGLPDEKYGEIVAAFIVPRSFSGWRDRAVICAASVATTTATTTGLQEDVVTLETPRVDDVPSETEIKNWVRERLSSHLVPKHIFYTPHYPKTASGKVQKFMLKELGKGLLKELEEKKTQAETATVVVSSSSGVSADASAKPDTGDVESIIAGTTGAAAAAAAAAATAATATATISGTSMADASAAAPVSQQRPQKC
ncbi:hypothetical protein AAFC00_000197 [Neodothiora populina]|uniref:Uncharacterized protein n=1 Tax=Neodothiora populina TaxID=2781224 RepID=A0ABR3P1Q6_9PEZI